MKARTRWAAALAAAVLLLAFAATAFAYQGQVAATATLAVRGSVVCEKAFVVDATFLDAEGAAVDGVTVHWTFAAGKVSGDAFTATSTTTNANGVAATTVELKAVTGSRTIRATSGDVSASIVVDQACGGLPRTSTVAVDASQPPAPVIILVLLGVVCAIAGGAMVFRRMA